MKKLLLVFLTVLLAFSVLAVPAFAEDAETYTVEDIQNLICNTKDLENFTVASVTAVSDEESYIIINGYRTIDENKVDFSYKYAIEADEFITLYNSNNSAIVFTEGVEFKAEAINVVYTAMERSEVNFNVNIFENFNAMGFVDHLIYMGLGMLGIFVVVGIVIFLTWLLNTITGKKKKA